MFMRWLVLPVLVLLGIACGSPQGEQGRMVPLGNVWYLGFGFEPSTGECVGGQNSTVWNGPGQTVYLPAAGLYCGGDPGYYRQALRAMEEAGFSFTLVSWNGWGDTNLDGTEDSVHFHAQDRAALDIFDYLDTGGSKLKIALLVEPFFSGFNPQELTKAQKQELLDYIWERFYQAHPGATFLWGEKPLLVTFTFSLSDTGDTRFTFRQWGDPPLAEWAFFPHEGLKGLHIGPDGGTIIFPRFDQFYLWLSGDPSHAARPLSEITRVDPTLDGRFYDQAWRWVFEHREQVKLVVVYAWNAWAEQASIEPASVGPQPYGKMLVETTRWYYDRLVQGKAYSPFKESVQK